MKLEESHQNHHHLFSFNSRRSTAMPPRGFVTVRVGLEGDEKLERFAVPVEHLKHPLFLAMLDEAEREFGFEQKGAIVIPCPVDRFCRVEAAIDREIAGDQSHHHGGSHHHHHHYHVPHIVGCFRA